MKLWQQLRIIIYIFTKEIRNLYFAKIINYGKDWDIMILIFGFCKINPVFSFDIAMCKFREKKLLESYTCFALHSHSTSLDFKENYYSPPF